MQTITVSTQVSAPIETVWALWNNPEDITNWYHASDDWYVPKAENDLRVGGRFSTVMAARDGSASFDFEGTYTDVVEFERIGYAMDDGRKVTIEFTQEEDGGTSVSETFEIEEQHSPDQQRAGWQSILENFREYVEKE